MGMQIEAAVTSRRGWFPRGALHMSDLAARACLSRAHRSADELDLLVNTGMYKNGNAAEPALASIIQDDIGANPELALGHHGTFSFDLVDGGCGVVQAAQIVDGFVSSGRARLAMIVAGDADPSPLTSHQFPFVAAAGAIVLGYVPGPGGFRVFRIRTFPEDAGLFESTLHWDAHAGLLHRGRNVLDIREAPDYADRLVDRAEQVVRELLAEQRLEPESIDKLVASQYPASFALRLAWRLRIPDDRVPSGLPDSHTAGPIAALETAIGDRELVGNTLFVTAGAGITIATALYRA
jgi:3-oxoacyl-[acyl-carrier-protein] synthase-3